MKINKKIIKNILIIALDTLRQDHLGCYGYKRNTTPNLDKFSKKSILFKNAYSVSSWTAPSFASIFTSVLPSRHKVIRYGCLKKISKNLSTITAKLNKKGFLTASFDGGGHVSDKYGFKKGFKISCSKGVYFKHNLDECIKFIEKNHAKKKFIFLHGFDCHRPYDPPKEFDIFLGNNKSNYNVLELYSGKNAPIPKIREDFEKIISKYDGNIRMADYYIGKFFRYLEKKGYFSNSVIFIISDHGDEFFEHKHFDHIRSLYEEVVKIPLILYYPGINPSVMEYPVSIMDIGSTICEFLNIKLHHNDGISLLNPRKTRIIFMETGLMENTTNYPSLIRAIIKKNKKMIFNKDMQPIELYDLEDDKNEQKNLVNNTKFKKVISNLNKIMISQKIFIETKYEDFEEENKEDFEEENKEDFEEETKKRLKSLGYF